MTTNKPWIEKYKSLNKIEDIEKAKTDIRDEINNLSTTIRAIEAYFPFVTPDMNDLQMIDILTENKRAIDNLKDTISYLNGKRYKIERRYTRL